MTSGITMLAVACWQLAAFAEPAPPTVGATDAHGTLYTLRAGSAFGSGHGAPGPGARARLRGSFRLAPGEPDGLFATYLVTDVRWTASAGSTPLYVSGSGNYWIGGLDGVTHRLQLVLQVGNMPLQRFDSGQVTLDDDFPTISISAHGRGGAGLDPIVVIVAEPSSGQGTACCFPDGSCAELPPENCLKEGGIPQEQDSSCETVDCGPPPPRVACCLPDGFCEDIPLEHCIMAGGEPHECTCETVECHPPPPEGACCLPNAECIMLPAEHCLLEGGVPHDGTCDMVDCHPPPPEIACCLPHGECIMLPAEHCLLEGGEPHDGTCDMVDCDHP